MPTPTILVVDDDQPLVILLKENLELEGYRVIMGFDGGMAINLAMSQQPDLIVLDINMPTTNGFDALTYLRKTPETKSIPVIFMTGIESKTLYPIIDRHQRVAYVKKPLDLEHLNSLIRQFLEQYPVKKEPAPMKQPDAQPASATLDYIEKIT
jgi:two-component system response regulator VicR